MISLIIPIYNTGKYLEKCLESIRNQTYEDFEVIMIDDGSTDNSALICKKYEKQDSRFKYFFKENGGSGSARNCGLKNAKGDYIAFIDSDDYVETDYLEDLSKHCSEGWDIIQCGMWLENNGSKTELSPINAEYTELNYIKTIIKRDINIFLFQTTVVKLYNRLFLEKSGVLFDEEIISSEDCLFNTMLLPHVRSVKTISTSKYFYRQNNSYISKLSPTFNKVYQSIRVGNITSGIRYDLIIQNCWKDDYYILKGFESAICIIYLSNAREIECGRFSKREKKELYEAFFSVVNYPIDIAINDFKGTDRMIARACANKDCNTISRIYKLRKMKKTLSRIIMR